ncbi:MAG: PEP-CTERM sorting domain-containing protein [Planctomycetota bacterium]
MRAAKLLLAAMIMVGLSATSAPGGTIKTIIDGLGHHDEHFSDRSWEQVIDVDGDTFISAGDILEGVFDFESVGREGGVLGADRTSVGRADPVAATGHFRLSVVSVTAIGGPVPFYAIEFAPETTFEDRYGTGAMAVAFEGTGPTNNFDATKPIPQVILDATDGDHLVTLGFTGAEGESWAAGAYTNSLAEAAGAGSFAFGFFQANVNRIFSPGEQNDFWSLEIPKSQTNLALGGATEFSLNGQLYGTRGASFPLSNSADVLFEVVPEPSTLIGLLMGALALAGYGWRRRKR